MPITNISLNLRRIKVTDGIIDDYAGNLSFNPNGQVFPSENCSRNYNTNTDYEYMPRPYDTIQSISGTADTECLFLISGGWTGAIYFPQGASNTNRSGISISVFCTYESTYCVSSRVAQISIDEISANGEFYKDDSGNWHDIKTDNIVATAQEVSNLPQDVEFNGWLFEHEVIEGDDGNYYDTDGNEMFSNLPSGVIPTSKIVSASSDGEGGIEGGIYEADDGNYYDGSGNQILENLPSGVAPTGQIGDVVVGDDGSYYDIHGDDVMSNLPSGVSIVSYDDNTNSYVGSDGNHYDINGDEVEPQPPEPSCDGVELTFCNVIRLTVDCIDIFGNQKNIGADITIGQGSVDLSQLLNLEYIRQINRITARTFGTQTESCGSGRLIIRAPVVGAKVALDVEGVDVDAVLGNYIVATCIFNVCDRYAEIVLNPDLPLGLANHTDLDVGYYCLNQFLYFDWEGFSDVFPYCCPSYDTSEKESGSTPSPVEDKDMSKLIESIDKLTEAVQGLSTLVEVVVSPADDVNIYNRRFHYNDENGVSGFSS